MNYGRYFVYILSLCFLSFVGGTVSAIELDSSNIGLPPFNCSIVSTICDLSNKSITSIASGTFVGYSNLQQLHLNNNQLTELNVGVFSGLMNLSNLTINNNFIQTLFSGVFSDLLNIDRIELSYNQIAIIDTGAFDGLSSLDVLTLYNNQITYLPYGIFDDLTNLTYLHASNNQLRNDSLERFSHLSNLSYLWLFYNNYTYISTGIFDNLSNLLSLGLNNNQLTGIALGAFDNLSGLTYLGLYGNNLSYISTGIFDNLVNINSLGLYNNQLTGISLGVFNNFNNLQYLDIRNNKLTSLPIDMFDALTGLLSLNITNNKLSNLPNNFLGLVNLTTLNIGYNCLISTNLSGDLIVFLDNNADDLPDWASLQNSCSLDFSVFHNLLNTPFAGMQNTFGVRFSQPYSISSMNNYIDLYTNNILAVDLSQNTGWNHLGSGVYRYLLSDFTGAINQNILLTGTIFSGLGGFAYRTSGNIVTSNIDLNISNNTSYRSIYINPATDMYMTGLLLQTGSTSHTVKLYYDNHTGSVDTDTIIVGYIGSGNTIVSSGWSNIYPNGDIFFTGDICYDLLFDESGPYFSAIENKIRSQLFGSLDDYLVSNFGYVSDPTHAVENLAIQCNILGYPSLYTCINSVLGLSFSKNDYPQCGGPKLFGVPGDICYDEFLEETGEYWNNLENVIINSYGYASIEDRLLNDHGITSSSGQIGESIISLCTASTGFNYNSLSDCFFYTFNIDIVHNSSSACGKTETYILPAKFISSSSSIQTIDIQTQNLSGSSFSGRFEIFTNILDRNVADNIWNYNFTQSLSSQVETGSRGGALYLVKDTCPDGDYSDSYYDRDCGQDDNIYNDTITEGYCYTPDKNLSFVDSVIVETSPEFKKAFLFLNSFDMTMFHRIDDFKIYDRLTREQAAKFFVNFATHVLCRRGDTSLNIEYADISQADTTLKPYIKKAYQLGLMKGHENLFRPFDYITRAEFNAVLIRMIINSYLPENSGNYWYSSYNKASRKLGISKYVLGSSSILRRDAALMLFRAYKNQIFSLSGSSFVLKNKSALIED